MAVHNSLRLPTGRLNRLLATALEFEGVERTAWLEALGAEDRHLRAVLVDLLTQSDATGFARRPIHRPQWLMSPRKRSPRCGASSPAIASVHGN